MADTPSPDAGEPYAGELGDGVSATATARKAQRRVRTGDVLGRYELGDELGEGGMATVYRARDRELRRDVAVKVLFPHLARRVEIVHRFHREARAAAGLEHPNILRIYDVGGGEAGDPPYIVMELIRGRTLLQEVEQRGAMLAEVVACIGALLGDALSAAHAAGIIHRDVKPANVLIAPGGKLLLADFGVARLETEDSLVTRTGALLGTPAYMSPEQASGDIATARSDLYSLGATLYQLATGALPYTGSPARAMLLIAAGHLIEPVRRHPACGPDLSRFIERVMACDPAQRPPSATAIAGELRALAAGSGLDDPGEELAAYFENPDGFLRARTPVVVAAVVAAANAAIAEAKLPRAMALADRASALARGDPVVAALVRTVTEGGHASRRRRALAIACTALVVAGGVTALIWQLARGPDGLVAGDLQSTAGTVNEPSTPVAQASPDAARGSPGAGIANPDRAALGEDAAPVAALDAGVAVVAVAAPLDAHSTRSVERPPSPIAAATPHDAAGRLARGAAVLSPLPPAAPPDAAPALPEPLPPDAAVAPAPAAAPVAGGHLIIHNGLWCHIFIDGVLLGNRRDQLLDVTAGHHVVRCVNPSGEWTQEADVAPGGTLTLTGPPLKGLTVTLEVDATIDGKPYPRGAVVTLRPGNVEVIAGDKKQFITFRVSCALRDTPTLGCYL